MDDRYRSALDAIDALIVQTADEANRLAGLSHTFDAIGAGTGVGLRLKALHDARGAVIQLALEEMDAAHA